MVKLKEHIHQNGKIPSNLGEIKDSNIFLRLRTHRQTPKEMLGLIQGKKAQANSRLSQERIDILTEAGLNWTLTAEQVAALKEKYNLIFPLPPPPKDVEKEEVENIQHHLPTLMRHSWLQMYHALLEFRKKHGHTHVTPTNSTIELYNWVCEERKKMQKLFDQKSSRGTAFEKPLPQTFTGYQAELLLGIDFMYSKGDIEWFDNYERLCGE